MAALPGRVAAALAAAAAVDLAPLPLDVAAWMVGMVRPKEIAADPALTWLMDKVAGTTRKA